MKKMFATGALLSAAMLLTAQASGAVIAHEGFSADAYTDGDIRTQQPASVGFAGEWAGTTNGYKIAGSVDDTAIAIIPSSVGAVKWPGGSNVYNRHVERNLASYTAENTYYLSFVNRRGSWAAESVYTDDHPGVELKMEATMGFANAENSEGVKIGYTFHADDTENALPSLVIKAGTQEILATTGSTYAQTFTTLMKLELDVDGTQDKLSWYVAGGTDSTPSTSDFSTEALAESTAKFKGVYTGDILTGNDSLSQLMLGSPDRSGIVYFDEATMATTWADATGIEIPEPASLALFGLGGLAMLRRRK
ncbi:PEP-CTERM sorting domain-containing protein [Planctomycetota bacterium]|nr:PEP-CTERM sorting domain-containing protein [Planctomycetota bacterium]